MDAVIARFINTEIAAAKAVAADTALSTHEKTFRILSGARRNHECNTRLEMEANAVNNAEMQQKTMASIVLGLSPLLTAIVAQGMKVGTFKIKYSKECVEILLTASKFLLHGTVFQWDKVELLQKAKALSWTAEQILATK